MNTDRFIEILTVLKGIFNTDLCNILKLNGIIGYLLGRNISSDEIKEFIGILIDNYPPK